MRFTFYLPVEFWCVQLKHLGVTALVVDGSPTCPNFHSKLNVWQEQTSHSMPVVPINTTRPHRTSASHHRLLLCFSSLLCHGSPISGEYHSPRLHSTWRTSTPHADYCNCSNFPVNQTEHHASQWVFSSAPLACLKLISVSLRSTIILHLVQCRVLLRNWCRLALLYLLACHRCHKESIIFDKLSKS